METTTVAIIQMKKTVVNCDIHLTELLLSASDYIN